MTEQSSSQFQPDAIPYLHQSLNKTLNADDFEYCKKSGYELKTGPFMPDEDDKIRENMRLFLQDHPEKTSDWLLGFNENSRDKDRNSFLNRTYFYPRLAHGLFDRSTDSVRQRARKILHRYAGNTYHKYYSPEETAKLVRFYAVYGKQYLKLAELMHRTPSSVERKLAQLKVLQEPKNFYKEIEFERIKENVFGIIREKNETIWMNCDSFRWDLVAENDQPPEICGYEWVKFASSVAEKYLVSILKWIKKSEEAVDKDSVPWNVIVIEFNLCNIKSVKRLFKIAKKYFLQYKTDVDFSDLPFKKQVKKMAKFFNQINDYTREVDKILMKNEKILPKILSEPPEEVKISEE